MNLKRVKSKPNLTPPRAFHRLTASQSGEIEALRNISAQLQPDVQTDVKRCIQ